MLVHLEEDFTEPGLPALHLQLLVVIMFLGISLYPPVFRSPIVASSSC